MYSMNANIKMNTPLIRAWVDKQASPVWKIAAELGISYGQFASALKKGQPLRAGRMIALAEKIGCRLEDLYLKEAA